MVTVGALPRSFPFSGDVSVCRSVKRVVSLG